MAVLYDSVKHSAGCASLFSGDSFWSVIVNKRNAYGKMESYDYGLMEPNNAMVLFDRVGHNLRRISMQALDEDKKMCAHEISELKPCDPECCPLGMGRCTCWDEFRLSCNLRVR